MIARDDLSLELTPLGYLRWYIHPDIPDVVDRCLYSFELEIPTGSRSGRLQHQGGIVHLVIEGQGHTILGSDRHDWEALDVIAIPPQPDGVVFQHFNDGVSTARLLLVFPNYDTSLGPELGAAMDVVDPAPEYRLTTSGGGELREDGPSPTVL